MKVLLLFKKSMIYFNINQKKIIKSSLVCLIGYSEINQPNKNFYNFFQNKLNKFKLNKNMFWY